MATALRHRGPDHIDTWCNPTGEVALGHARLAILDLSPAGRQPMQSKSGQFQIVFNGEIYNHLAIRQSLESRGTHLWIGESDTETLLAGFEQWGIEATVRACVGMFAFAVWDTHTSTLTLARDRLGEKPLYYGWQGDTFFFGSELKAMRRHPEFKRDVDRDALGEYMRFGYVPAPRSIYSGISKLAPGRLAAVSVQDRSISVTSYWDASERFLHARSDPFKGSEAEAADELDHLLREAVSLQMIADVPVGAFLSGGVDSSTIVALMQAVSAQRVRTFSIGFTDERYDEAPYARAVAQHLGTDHVESYVTGDDALAVVPHLARIYDEPFADASQIPTVLVARMAAGHVKVALSGDAGDELFAGYNRYLFAERLWGRLTKLSPAVRAQIARLIVRIPPHKYDRLARALAPLLPESMTHSNTGAKLHKGAGVIAATDERELYRLLVSAWHDPALVVLGMSGGVTPSFPPLTNGREYIRDMMAWDAMTYLPDDILCKVDRAAMSASLETRVPLLDHRVVEFAWRLPQSYLLEHGKGKRILRDVLHRYVPRSLIERPKRGFGIPLDQWLRGPLREWAEALLDENRLRADGYFDPGPIRRAWAEHQEGRRNMQAQLWPVIMFQAWLEESGT